MRLFVAVLPPPEALGHLSTAIEGLHVVRAGAGLEPPERWHLTAVFLGETADDRLETICARLAEGAAAGRPATLALAGGGHFGETVLWTGVDGELDALVRTVRALRRHLRQARVELERRPYRPHLTLARPRARVTPQQLRDDVATLKSYRGPSWTADRVHLMRSTQYRTPTGLQAVRYESLADWPTYQA
ncbi:RNA 2',3'-cyclic phosphodiesterase [Cryptosporangium sp. NPDC051539]|uniref:RNA 2',3'-cyclic phosphodiesterase n=1 Tax=Cryptosporangium sp. NPDC051539 TaxID=3363962 RepID=UPI00379BFC01